MELVGGWPAGMDEDGAALRTRARRARRGQRAGRLPGMAVLERELGLVRTPALGDGNCLLHALGAGGTGTVQGGDGQPLELPGSLAAAQRRRVARVMREQRELLLPHCSLLVMGEQFDSFDAYVGAFELGSHH